MRTLTMARRERTVGNTHVPLWLCEAITESNIEYSKTKPKLNLGEHAVLYQGLIILTMLAKLEGFNNAMQC
jgi:hypothetical protein